MSRVINQMLECAFRFVTTILDDANVYSSHAKKATVDADDVAKVYSTDAHITVSSCKSFNACNIGSSECLINPSLIESKNILITTNMVSSQSTANDSSNALKRKREDDDDDDGDYENL
ncbi:hypothetical protein P7K49_034009 [Saguinus oedipus]|uniref:Uncharacterized protein n=1 Tax=Saguinus oedipus TaxID=9490 RepID=A0ABQ9TVB5_SAGOE|nr:hypothetical protein P7K49_034009 [Saguinus oedipus]